MGCEYIRVEVDGFVDDATCSSAYLDLPVGDTGSSRSEDREHDIGYIEMELVQFESHFRNGADGYTGVAYRQDCE